MSNFSSFVGIIAGVISIALAIPTFLEHKKNGLSKATLLLMSVVIVVLLGAGVYFSTSATITPHYPTLPFTANATEPPTATPIPTATPSPTPTPQVIQINQTMTCTDCTAYHNYSLIVRSATIDPAKIQTTFLIGVQNLTTSTDDINFSFLKLQDTQTGTTTEGAGDGFSGFMITAQQLILFRPTFQFVPVAGHKYSFSAQMSGFNSFSPITITF